MDRTFLFKSITKWLLAILFATLCTLNFIRIDSGSHSASDTLRPFIIQTAILAVIFFMILLILAKKKEGKG